MKQYQLAATLLLAFLKANWAWVPNLLLKAGTSSLNRNERISTIAATTAESGAERVSDEAKAYGGPRWEGDATRRPLGSMERLLNARRSWGNHAMTTAHVSTAVLSGPPPTPEELTTALTWVIRRHPLLASVIRGKGKYHVPNAQPYPLHDDYLKKSVEYTDELLRIYPDDDVERFEPSSLTPSQIATRALEVVRVNEAANETNDDGNAPAHHDASTAAAATSLQEAWREGMRRSMDELVVGNGDDDEGPLWRLKLYTTSTSGSSSSTSTSGGASSTTSSTTTSSTRGGNSDSSSSDRSSGSSTRDNEDDDTPPTFALGWAANHAGTDQLSFHIVLSQLLKQIALRRKEASVGSGVAADHSAPPQPTPLPLPPSVEGALLGPEQRQGDEIKTRLELILGSFESGNFKLPHWVPGRLTLSTIQYAIWQMANSKAQLLPKWVPSPEKIEADPCAEANWGHQARRTSNEFRIIDADKTSALLSACRKRKVTISSVLCAAAALGASDVMGDGSTPATTQRYKILQALDMRPFPTAKCSSNSNSNNNNCSGSGGSKTSEAKISPRTDWSQGTVVAGTGSLDLLVDLPPQAGESCRAHPGDLDTFWSCARECRRQTVAWVQKGWPRESLLLFSSGWEFMNMNRVVELGSQDRATLGRAYSAGISNVGVFGHPTSYGDLSLREVFFGISQTVSAPAVSVSAATVGGKLCLAVHTATPLWPQSEAAAYADKFVRTLELAAAEEGTASE